MRLTSLIFLLLLADNGFAAPDIQIQTRLEPGSGLHVGQPVSFEIDVLTDTWLTGTPDFDTLTLPDALVEFEGSQGRSIQRDIGGKRYFGVTFSYRLVPLEPGVITVPELPVQVSVGQSDAPIDATVPRFSFPVQPLSGSDTTSDMLLAGDVQITQRVIPSGESIQVGQPVTREIRVVADRALPLSIPPLSVPPLWTHNAGSLAGTSLSADINTLTDGRGRTTGGERVERIRYLGGEVGTLALPPMILKWWDIDENRVKQTTLAAMELEVTNPTGASTPVAARFQTVMRLAGEWISRQNPLVWLMLIATAGSCIWAGRRYGRAIINFGVVLPLNQWRRSTIRLRFRAIRELRGNKPVLNGVYRLVRRVDGQATIRDSRLHHSSRAALLEGVSQYYSRVPDRRSAYNRLRGALRRLNKQQRDPKSRLVDLNSLNPERSQGKNPQAPKTSRSPGKHRLHDNGKQP